MNDSDFCSLRQVKSFTGYFWARGSLFSFFVNSVMVKKFNMGGYPDECDLGFG